MNKTIFVLLLFFIINIACQRNEVVKTHGLSYLEKRQKLIVVNKSNKNDAMQILGQPATKGMTDDNLWIYIERTRVRGKLLKLGRTSLKKNNVLVLEFNKYGVLEEKLFYDKDKMRDHKFSQEVTENVVKKGSFVESFLSSLRRKMNANRELKR